MEENTYYNRRNSKDEIRYVGRWESEYPKRLLAISNPPAGIYVKGRLPEEDRLTVGMVGARMCSEYGRSAAREFAGALASAGVQIISGMAKGIDGISQREAIAAGGSTFGVLGCGLDVVYPVQNREIFEKICERGGLISEFPPDTPPIARNFPIRNRIISGLSDILLVIEAGEKSGTGITVTRALEQGKDIYALPGRIYDSLSAGCNRLICQGAGIALSPGEFMKNLEDRYAKLLEKAKINGKFDENKHCIQHTDRNKKNINMLEKSEKVVYSGLDLYPKDLENIALETGMHISEILEILIKLELKGYIREEGKNHYIRFEE